MKSTRLAMLVLILLFFPFADLQACTAFCLRHENKIIFGKNLDWVVGHGFIFVNQRDVQKTAFVNSGGTPITWTSKYGSITFNQFGREFPLGGINEAGLVIEELMFSPSLYPAPDNRFVINELQWIQYQLDNHKSVAEVIASDSLLRISRFLFNLHYLVCDSFGNVAVVEFLDGRSHFYTADDLPIPVLCNNSYLNSLHYLKFHKGFGGDRIVSDGPESPERLVRAATLITDYDPRQHPELIDYGFDILKSVQQCDTRWSIIYDIGNLKVLFKSKKYPFIRSIKLADFNYLCDRTIRICDINSGVVQDSKPRFVEYSSGQNRSLLTLVFEELYHLDELDEAPSHGLLDKLAYYPESLECLAR